MFDSKPKLLFLFESWGFLLEIWNNKFFAPINNYTDNQFIPIMFTSSINKFYCHTDPYHSTPYYIFYNQFDWGIETKWYLTGINQTGGEVDPHSKVDGSTVAKGDASYQYNTSGKTYYYTGIS